MEFRILGPLEVELDGPTDQRSRATSPVPCSGCSSCTRTSRWRPSS